MRDRRTAAGPVPAIRLPGGGSRFDEPALVGEDDGLDAVAQVELGEDAGDVRLHRRLADEQLGGDLGVGQPAGEQPQDLELARAQLGQRRGGRAGQRSA